MEKAFYTIKILNLDDPRLNSARQEAMWSSGVMEELDDAARRELEQKYSALNDKGEYAPFCDAILYWLEAESGI